MYKVSFASFIIAGWIAILIILWLITGNLAKTGQPGPSLPAPSIPKTTIQEDDTALITTGQNSGTTPSNVVLADHKSTVQRYSQQETMMDLLSEFAATYNLGVATGRQDLAISEPYSTAVADLGKH